MDELFGVCAMMKIPFVVIVQPHLLRDKGSVRLRRIRFDTLSGGGNEVLVSLDNLASTISSGHGEEVELSERSAVNDGFDAAPAKTSLVECIYVDTDQYYGLDKQVSKSDTSNWKAVLKSIKGVTQRSEAFLDTLTDTQVAAPVQGTPVFCVHHLSFWEIREFGTLLMQRNGDPIAASWDATELHPKRKKVFKTLAMAIDNLLKKYAVWKQDSTTTKQQLTLLLYSKVDDRFDMVTLDIFGSK